MMSEKASLRLRDSTYFFGSSSSPFLTFGGLCQMYNQTNSNRSGEGRDLFYSVYRYMIFCLIYLRQRNTQLNKHRIMIIFD